MSAPAIAPVGAQLFGDPQEIAAKLKSRRGAEGAREFEASLFSGVLEKMEKNLSIEDEDSNDAGHDTCSALAVSSLAKGLAQGHLLGISDMIERSLGLKAGSTAGTLPDGAGGKENSALSLKPLK